MTLTGAYTVLYAAALLVLAALLILSFVRVVKGPRTTDRLVGINIIGTIVNVAIGILATALGETYLADICLIYSMVSFLAVVVLTKAYLGVHAGRNRDKEGQRDE